MTRLSEHVDDFVGSEVLNASFGFVTVGGAWERFAFIELRVKVMKLFEYRFRTFGAFLYGEFRRIDGWRKRNTVAKIVDCLGEVVERCSGHGAGDYFARNRVDVVRDLVSKKAELNVGENSVALSLRQRSGLGRGFAVVVVLFLATLVEEQLNIGLLLL